jgi:hypothetical protein
MRNFKEGEELKFDVYGTQIKGKYLTMIEDKFVPNTNYSRTTHSGMDLYIGVNGKVKTKFFGK